MAIPPIPVAVRNRLLAALPPDVLARLLPKLHPVSLSVRDTLYRPDTVITAVTFVESGWVSLVAALDDGAQAEVGLIGREGMVGLPLVLGVDTGFEEAFVQADGTGLRMEAGAFRRAMGEEPELRHLMFRYHMAMNAQTTQTAACNGRHDLEQRLLSGCDSDPSRSRTARPKLLARQQWRLDVRLERRRTAEVGQGPNCFCR